MVKYEYLRELTSADDFNDNIDARGRRGWLLQVVIPPVKRDGTGKYFLVYVRPLVEPELNKSN